MRRIIIATIMMAPPYNGERRVKKIPNGIIKIPAMRAIDLLGRRAVVNDRSPQDYWYALG
jgi:hypothetical protein